MEPDGIMNVLQEWYGHQGRYSGLSSNVYYQRETGITMALVMNGYEYKLEDKKGSIVLSGWKKQDGTAQIRAECRRS